MLEFRHILDNKKNEIYTAIYLDDLLLVDWTKNGIIEINSKHPEVIIAKHVNHIFEK